MSRPLFGSTWASLAGAKSESRSRTSRTRRSFTRKWPRRKTSRASHRLFEGWRTSWPAEPKAAQGSLSSARGTFRSSTGEWPGKCGSWPRRCCPMKIEGGKLRGKGARLEIDELKERYEALNEAKIRAEEKKKEKL